MIPLYLMQNCPPQSLNPKPHNIPDLNLNAIAASPNPDNRLFASQPAENWASSNRNLAVKPTPVKMIAGPNPWFVWHFFSGDGSK